MREHADELHARLRLEVLATITLLQDAYLNLRLSRFSAKLRLHEPCEERLLAERARDAWVHDPVSDLPCNVRREAGQSLVIGGSSLVMLEGNACNPL